MDKNYGKICLFILIAALAILATVAVVETTAVITWLNKFITSATIGG